MGGPVAVAVPPQLELQAPEIVTAAANLTGTGTELGTEPGTEVASGRVSETVAVSCRVQACLRVSAGQPALATGVLTATVTGRMLLHGAAQQQAVMLLM